MSKKITMKDIYKARAKLWEMREQLEQDILALEKLSRIVELEKLQYYKYLDYYEHMQEQPYKIK